MVGLLFLHMFNGNFGVVNDQFNISYASAVAVALAAVLMAVSALYARHLARTTLAEIS